MSKIITLANTLRKCGKGQHENSGSKQKNDILFYILGAIVSVLLFLFGKSVGPVINGDPFVIVKSLGLLAGVCIFFISISRLINSLYMSTDLPLLTTMPFSAFQLALVRMINASYLSFGIAFIFLVPFTLGYAIFTGAAISLYISIFLMLILVPVFSMCISAILIIIIFSIFKFARNKDLISVIGVMFTLVILSVIIYLENNKAAQNVDIQALALNISNSISGMVAMVPPVYFICEFGETVNVLYLFISIAITAAAFLLFYLFSKYFYLNSALAMQTTSAGGRKLSREMLKKSTKQSFPVKSYMSKELKLLRRNPAYLMNCFVMTFSWPVVFGLVIALGSGMFDDLSNVKMMDNNNSMLIVLGVCIGIASFVVAMNYIGLTSVSREGASFYYMKTMPITYRDQSTAKRNVALYICNIGTTLYISIILLVLCIIGVFPFWTVIECIAMTIPYVWIMVDLQIMWGVKNVNLDWDNETQAQQSMFPLAEFFSGFLITGVLAALAFVLVSFMSIPFYLVAIVIVALLVGCAIIIDKSMFKYTRKKLNLLQG